MSKNSKVSPLQQSESKMKTNNDKFNLDLSQVKEIIALLKESEIEEIELAQGEMSLRVKNHSIGGAVAMPAAAPVASTTVATTASETSTAKADDDSAHKLTSPMVGTFYRAPSPEASNFAEVGQKVKKGQTLCIIEAMKTMNQIEADKSGTIKSVLVENGQPVEYGEVLFLID